MEVHGLQLNVFWRAQARSINPIDMLSQIPSCLSLRAVPKNSSRILANIVHTCQVGFHVDLSSTKNVMSYGPKVLLCNPQAGARDTLTSENSRILKTHGLMTFVQTCP